MYFRLGILLFASASAVSHQSCYLTRQDFSILNCRHGGNESKPVKFYHDAGSRRCLGTLDYCASSAVFPSLAECQGSCGLPAKSVGKLSCRQGLVPLNAHNTSELQHRTCFEVLLGRRCTMPAFCPGSSECAGPAGEAKLSFCCVSKSSLPRNKAGQSFARPILIVISAPLIALLHL